MIGFHPVLSVLALFRREKTGWDMRAYVFIFRFCYDAEAKAFSRSRESAQPFAVNPSLGDCSMGDSESFLVTVPLDWDLKEHAESNRKFPSVQDFIRELIRRDIESYDKDKAAAESAKTNGK